MQPGNFIRVVMICAATGSFAVGALAAEMLAPSRSVDTQVSELPIRATFVTQDSSPIGLISKERIADPVAAPVVVPIAAPVAVPVATPTVPPKAPVATLRPRVALNAPPPARYPVIIGIQH